MRCLDTRLFWFTEAKLLTDTSCSYRINALLTAAHHANETIKSSHPETFFVCQKALAECGNWVDNEKSVLPETLASYLDAEDSQNPWMQETLFNDDPDGLNALIFITMVIGHISHIAYINAGKYEQMSEIIAEAGENIFQLLLDNGKKYGLPSLA